LTGGKPLKTFALNIDAFRWMPDATSFVYLDNKNGVRTFWSQPLVGGKPKQLTNSTGERIWSLNLSPYGKQIALTRGTETRDVVLISGFRR
jgi:Tol biopolymer transport system component